MTAVQSAAGYRHFHEQLDTLKQRLLDMSERAEALVELAVESLLKRDKAAAEAVIEGDHEVDALEIDIEQMAVALLALQQPMARDLRFILGAIKVSSDLERVGDHSVNIAQCAVRLATLPGPAITTPEIEDMAHRARKMLADALDAFIRGDGPLGRAVCASDDAVDALHDSVFKTLMSRMAQDPAAIAPAMQLVLVSRNLERVADMATNIGEDAVYLAEGKQIKHHHEERSSARQQG